MTDREGSIPGTRLVYLDCSGSPAAIPFPKISLSGQFLRVAEFDEDWPLSVTGKYEKSAEKSALSALSETHPDNEEAQST